MTNRWQKLYEKKPLAWLAVFLVIMIALGAILALAPRAFSATSSQRSTCTHNPDMTCAVTPARAVRLFKAGHYDRAHGLAWDRVTTHPRAVRAVFRHKYARFYMNASASKQQAIRTKYGLFFSSRTGEGCTLGWGMAACAAKQMLGSMNRVSCASSDPWANTGTDSCVTLTGIIGLHHGNGLTKDQVQKSGSVGFCGAGSMLMVRSAVSTPTPFAYLAAGVGTGACLFSAWTLFDPA